MRKVLLLMAVCSLSATTLWAQGSTTAAMSGTVQDENGESLPGATVRAVHTPTGTSYGAATNLDGQYNLRNMRVGGPYTVTVTFVGYQPRELSNIYLTLGQTQDLNFDLRPEATELEEVQIIGQRDPIIDGNRTGASTTVTEEQINALPTIGRDLSDFTRLTPQASVTETGDGPAISIAGQNNRYNSIFVDGAVNNDVFGLSGSGANGGQTGLSPISLDAIEQFQIVVSPYDVTLGNFTGGGINVVTRSGTNDFEGSAYYLLRNEALAGQTPTENEDARVSLPDFSSQTYGLRIGGPIIRNKLFFFVSAEQQRIETPQPFNFDDYEGASSLDTINLVRSFVRENFGYDVGGFENNPREQNSDKILAKINWNINDRHQLSLRHSYTYNEEFERNRSSERRINFQNNAEFFPSTTNSTALEVNSNFNNNFSNKLILGYTAVRDDRDPEGDPFPYVFIDDGVGQLRFGSERFSTANRLDQDIFTLTNNFTWFKGKHTVTVGTHSEFYSILNLFIRENFGVYDYASIDDFLNGATPANYTRSYSLVDNITGDESGAAAEFNAYQLGFYLQDEYQPVENLRLTGGLRVDIPGILDEPNGDPDFNTTTLPALEEYYDLQGARAGNVPDPQLYFSPRFGFNWDVFNDQNTQVRGGVGVFTGRVPFVWPGGVFTNSGVTVGGVDVDDPTTPEGDPLPFVGDVDNQFDATYFGQDDPIPSGQLDLLAEDFRYPQVFRTSLAVDQRLPFDVVATVEGIFTQTMNNIRLQNVNIKPPSVTSDGVDERPIYDRNDRIDPRYGRGIYLVTNTNQGYSYTLTAQLQKSFQNGLTGSVAYTYNDTRTINDGTSSQNSSQWRFLETVNGRNRAGLSRSDFGFGSRVIAFASYRKSFFDVVAGTLSLFYTAQSGQPFSYVYDNNGSNYFNGEDNSTNDLIYVPRTFDESNIVDIEERLNSDGTVRQPFVSAEDQWNALNRYIDNDDYLSTRRGQYAERNAARSPFEHIVDLRFLLDFYLTLPSGKRNTLQLSFDVFNFTNLLNNDWGRRFFVGNDQFDLIRFEGFRDEDNGDFTPEFTFRTDPDEDPFQIDDADLNSARWQAQVGVRYIFN